jgi:hypothetical protein
MSSTTWTPRAVASEARDCELPLWRAVEAQHVVATRALVDSLAEQQLLESLLDAAKPPAPAGCAGLDYLLYTPFRYPPVRAGSRFRRYTDAGVWYGAEQVRTSCAEIGYWRWRFVTDSEGLDRLDAVPHTIFQAFARGAAVDLRAKPFVRHRAAWTDAADYGPCQAFAATARQAGTQIIRYESVRDPQHGGCAAVLDCSAFASTGGVRKRQSWFLTVDRDRASWMRAAARRGESFEFVYA